MGVSACLLGQEVRHDGGHARDRFVHEMLAHWIEWTPVCPEVEVGMGVPRPTIRLVDEGEGVRLVDPRGDVDHTEAMARFSTDRVRSLLAEGLDGYVLKKNSPSCGMERLRVYRDGNVLHKTGRGVFAARLMELDPLLPVEEEGRLNDPPLRENFIERLFARNRWRRFLATEPGRGDLVRFHTAHKLLLRAHGEEGYRELGRIVAGAEDGAAKLSHAERLARYGEVFAAALVRKATVSRHVNVLQHALGYLKRELQPTEKQEILSAVEDYRQGLLPLAVPLALMRFVIRRHEVDYLTGQLYFDPHPKELRLRIYA